ncbi:S8 family serine peptidase [Halobaculum sp. MBLA0147]|uniref:S8 family peptidase n=1 Tax=Halobaculum sp. MBLA0147 TaxID=3079934 RepID=UPI0035234170
MVHETTRRGVLKLLSAATVVGASGRAFAAEPSEDRYVVDTAATETPVSEMVSAMEVVYDFRDVTPDGDGIEFVVVRGSESAMPAEARYTADLDVAIEPPEVVAAAEADPAAAETSEPLYDLQWDKREQQIERVHETATGDGTRIGVIDDGVLGANPDDDFAHPDLPNVRQDLSENFTADGEGPGPLNDDHGTHVAGTAAAAVNGAGVRGMAPDAEVVDLRVFSGAGASFADVAAAVVVGAAPEGAPVTVSPPANGGSAFTGAGCDVLNLSLGTPPIPEDSSGIGVTVDFLSAVGQFAVGQGALPVAAAGNDGTNLDDGVIVLPAEADGYVSVGATGPIGYGWPVEGRGTQVGPFTVERPIDTELPTYEPAFYTNYGAEGVDVTAGGGNVDPDGVGVVPIRRLLFDYVLSTTFQTDPDAPEDARLEAYTPSYGGKPGTSFAAPNVSGFAALLYEALGEDATPAAVRDRIESFAQPRPVGRAGETTAPGVTPNVSDDGTVDGDQPSAPGSAPGGLDADEYRGEGHVNVLPAVRSAAGGDDGNGRGGGDGRGGGNGRGNGGN